MGPESKWIRTEKSGSSKDPTIVTNWSFDYAFGLPLIVLTVVLHAYCLELLAKVVKATMNGAGRLQSLSGHSTIVVGMTVLSVTILHGFYCSIWAAAYRFLGALQDSRSAMLYSLNAKTSYGHENLNLEPRWQMLGALEALDGWILFGLTTAFLFTVIQKLWSHNEPSVSDSS
jgi:hypothetical protein